MEKIIFFDSENQKTDRCCGETYSDFIDYAFTKTDYFMLVYVDYYGKGYSEITKKFYSSLDRFKVKTRTNPGWPGTLKTICADTTYEIVFYRNSAEAKEILKQVDCLSDWSRPSNPEDLSFFKGNQCWFYSVGHEKLAAIIHATDDDLIFVEKYGLALKSDAYFPENSYFELFDEQIE